MEELEHRDFLQQLDDGFRAHEATEDPRVRAIGTLLADWDNLSSTIRRSQHYGDMGYPTVLPTGPNIHLACPNAVTTALLAEMNETLHNCAIRLTAQFEEALKQHRKTLENQIRDLVKELKPTKDQERGIEVIRKSKAQHIKEFPDLPKLEGSLPFLKGPDDSRSKRHIVPNYGLRRMLAIDPPRPPGRGPRRNNNRKWHTGGDSRNGSDEEDQRPSPSRDEDEASDSDDHVRFHEERPTPTQRTPRKPQNRNGNQGYNGNWRNNSHRWNNNRPTNQGSRSFYGRS